MENREWAKGNRQRAMGVNSLRGLLFHKTMAHVFNRDKGDERNGEWIIENGELIISPPSFRA